ncbi:MAG TPA: ribonuclease H-like domain-containing protein, partial [Polyangiales bacterium]|nr:ribonuclease H-like domain-containing protein [Polyangiales bacterium]
GTVPFLIGLAYFEQGALKVEQLFLDELGGEAPMLHHLAERLARTSVLVSYNGKAFDWPLLRTRFVINRVAVPALPPHLDLLHCARRLLRPRMSSVRLVDVERALLGFYREDDVAGAEIPGLYLDWLRAGDADALRPVLVHNEQDVIALAALIDRLCARYASVQPSADPDEHLACARVALKARDWERAHGFARAAADGGGAAALTHDAHALCATVAKKRGDASRAAEAWLLALAQSVRGERIATAHLALARLYERELSDLPRAYAHARHTLEAEGARAHGRRLGRLSRRLLKQTRE